jgi:hypothetical protein
MRLPVRTRLRSRISDEEAFLFQWDYVISCTTAALETDSEMEPHLEFE